MMPFSGERNSWLIVARNCDFAAFARRASSVLRRSDCSNRDRYAGIATSPSTSPTDR